MFYLILAVFHLSAAFVKAGVDRIEILAVQIVLCDANGITEALVMHKLALAKEFDWLPYVGVVAQTQNVVVGCARLLLC